MKSRTTAYSRGPRIADFNRTAENKLLRNWSEIPSLIEEAQVTSHLVGGAPTLGEDKASRARRLRPLN